MLQVPAAPRASHAAPPPPSSAPCLQENSDAILLKAALTILAECEGDLLMQEDFEEVGVWQCVCGCVWWWWGL